MTSHPTIGVEEEFLLVDPDDRRTGRRATKRSPATPPTHGVKLQLELTSCQVETTTDVIGGSDELRAELTRLRRIAAEAAEANGAQLLAVALPPTRAARVPDHRHPALPRDRRQVRHDRPRAGHLRCSRARRGADPRGRDPGQQPAAAVAAAAARADRELGGLPQHRHRLRQLAQRAVGAVAQRRARRRTSTPSTSTTRWSRCCSDAGAVLDDGMVYWDVRPSANFPTIEVRVADVPATVAETVLLATLIRASVMTALDEERRGEPTPPLTPHALRAAYWKSARDGLDGEAIDLAKTHASAPARMLLADLVEHVRPALEAVGDYDMVTVGTGTHRRGRATVRCGSGGRGGAGDDVADVIAEAATATLSDA